MIQAPLLLTVPETYPAIIIFFDTTSHHNTEQTQPNVRVYKKGQIMVELCSRAPWVRIFGYLCIQEILVLRKSSVRTSTPSCKLG